MNKQRGFTLLELMVVVSILAALAGITATAIGGYDQEARKQLVHTEMKNIAKAIYKFKQDTGYFPRVGIFKDEETKAIKQGDKLADLGFLYLSPKEGGNKIIEWDSQVGRGWNGPYLMDDSQQRLHTLNNVSKSFCGVTVTLTTSAIGSQNIIAVADTFDAVKENTEDDVCFVVHDSGGWVPKKASGEAYRYMANFENTNYFSCGASPGCIALLSAGPDGEFTGGISVDVWSDGASIGSILSGGDGDDIVKILRVN